MANYMESVAKTLGVKLTQRFKINGYNNDFFWLNESGLQRTRTMYDMSNIFEGLTGRQIIKEEPWKAQKGDLFFVPSFPTIDSSAKHKKCV